jgi:hypothetical protein
LDHRLEALVVRSAQHVTVAYAGLGRGICARHGHSGREKISVVATGFPEDLFQHKSPFSASKFTVVYAGNHFCEAGRHGEHFLRAIDEWIDLEPQLEEKVAFIFIGKRDDDLIRQRATMRHPQVVHLEPLTSHRACIQQLMSSHMCVVNTVGNRIPAKVYECIRAGKWTLALTDPRSDLAALMQQYSKGIVVPARDTIAIRRALQDIWRLRPAERVEAPQANQPWVRYSAKHSAESLARVFQHVLRAPSPGHSNRPLARQRLHDANRHLPPA